MMQTHEALPPRPPSPPPARDVKTVSTARKKTRVSLQQQGTGVAVMEGVVDRSVEKGGSQTWSPRGRP